MTDTVDEFWLQQVGEYQGKKFKSVTKGDLDLSKFETDKKKEEGADDSDEKPKSMRALLAYLTTELSGQVSFVRSSKRLTESPVCLVADEGGVDMHMEKVLKIQQKYEPGIQKVLEVNPNHPLIKNLSDMVEQDEESAILKDSAQLLMDQALIIQGESINDPSAFARRMADVMQKSLEKDMAA